MRSLDITYEMTMNVCSSWDKLKRLPNYKEVVGEMIFSRMLELEPRARQMFKFSPHEDVRQNPMFKVHALAIFQMLHYMIELLGPDMELLEGDLVALGSRHVKYGVHKEFLPIMCHSIDFVLTNLLGGSYIDNHRSSLLQVLDYIVSKMVTAM